MATQNAINNVQVNKSGVAGGQTIIGGTAANDDLILQTTSDATKGSYIFSEMTSAGFLKNDVNGVVTGGNAVTGFLANVVEDTTPQLGANIDCQGYTINGNTTSGGNLTLKATTHATQGSIICQSPVSSNYAAFNGTIPTAQTGSVITAKGCLLEGITIVGRYVYIATYTNPAYLMVVDISIPSSPVLVSTTTTGKTYASSIDVAGKYAYISCGDSTDYMVCMDISNPTTPVVVSSIAVGNNSNSVAVCGRYAYVNSDGDATKSLQVIDVSNPASMTVVASVNIATATGSRGVCVVPPYVYWTSSTNKTIYCYNINNPAVPSSVGSFLANDTTMTGLVVRGRYAYSSCQNGAGSVFRIIDLKDRANMASAGTIATDGSITGIAISGKYAYLADSTNAYIRVYDISDPASITLVGSFATSSSPTGIVLSGQYLYVSNNNGANSVLQVFNIGGASIIGLEASNIETTELYTRGKSEINGDLRVGGGINCIAGAQFNGPVSVYGTALGFSVTTDGKVGVGVAVPSETLEVSANARFQAIGSAASAGALHRTANGTLTTDTSDERMKINIEVIDSAISVVDQIEPIKFNWSEWPNDQKIPGLIAQDLKEILPEVVFKNDVDGFYGIHYNRLIPYLIKAIKELKAEIDILKG